MKTVRITLLTLFTFALFHSCTKEKSFETGGTGSLPTDWEFKEDKTYKGRVDTAYIEDFGSSIKTLFVFGTSSDGKNLFSIEVANINSSSAATYKTPDVTFQYLGAAATLYVTDPTAIGDFTVVITKIDSANIAGTFNGKVKDSTGKLKTIVDGKFASKLRNSSTPPPPPQNGKLTFWAKSSCTAGGNISIKLSNNQTGAISTFTPSEPPCEATGTASFTLPAGSYTWKANCGTQDSTSGTISVVANQCTKQEVLFVTATTNCKISDAASYDFSTNTPLGTYRTTYNSNNIVTNIKLIDSFNHQIVSDWNITYPAGRVQIDAVQYFLVDANSRVTEFHGYYDPIDNTSGLMIMKYTYDASGYMNMYTMADADTPAVIIWKGVLTWTNGNLTKIVENDPSVPSDPTKYETIYDYSGSQVKNFIYFFPLPEFTYFHTAINAGKNSQNAVTKETVNQIDPTGTHNLWITNYDQYTIENFYVKSFRNNTVGDPYSTKVVLSYRCF